MTHPYSWHDSFVFVTRLAYFRWRLSMPPLQHTATPCNTSSLCVPVNGFLLSMPPLHKQCDYGVVTIFRLPEFSVLFAKEHYKQEGCFFQKRHRNEGSLLIVAIPLQHHAPYQINTQNSATISRHPQLLCLF